MCSEKTQIWDHTIFHDLDSKRENLSVVRSRAGPSRCGAQCKTLAWGPSEQWFYDVIVFSQQCYDSGRAQICSAALTRELSTFANVREEICQFWRERSLLTTKFIWRFYWFLKRKVYLAKMNNLPTHHGAGPQRRGAQCSCIGLRPALVRSSDLSALTLFESSHFWQFFLFWG